ncbi:MAG: hypothetical protein LBQ09_09170 [Acidobacteriaceae bacterium]|jgi:hypothetical protein|nr:hypothetical protein [Acidobacteriaceae bacterium]
MTTPTTKVSADKYLVLLAWVAMLSILWIVQADPDLWGHLTFGGDLLREHHLSSSDPYSFTSDLPWVNHEWLAEVVMAALFRGAGTVGLFALKFFVAGVVATLLTWRLQRLPGIVQLLIIVVVMCAAVPIVTTVRPQLFSFACAAIVAFLLTDEHRPRRLSWLPLVFIVWANTHGGWLVGLGMVGCWCAFGLLNRATRTRAVAVGAAVLAATLVTPYGIGLWTFLYSTVGLTRDIQEWQPLTKAALIDWTPWLFTVPAIGVVALYDTRRDLWRLLTMAGLAYASFRVVRLVPFFALVSAMYVVDPLVVALGSRVERWRLYAPSRIAAALTLVPSLALVGLAAPSIVRNGSCIPVRGDWIPEPQTAAALQRARPSGRMVTPFGWGQYAIWHFGPQLQISLDGRRETVYSANRTEEFLALAAGLPRSFSLLEQLQPEYVWLPAEKTELEKRWLQEHGYRIDVDSGQAWIAVRADLPRIARAPLPSPACFPG